MKKISLILLGFGLVILLSGCNANGRFALRSKLTGEFATATASSTEHNGHYSIEINIHTHGLYNLLRGKRHEHYHSTGRVKNGIYYSDKLIIERRTDKNHLHSINEYRLDYAHKKITRHYQEWHGKKKVKESRIAMDYFGHDDYLTVLHNAFAANRKKKTTRKTYLVAASEETHGKVPVYFTKNPKHLKRWGAPTGGALLQMGIHKGIFKGGKGSMTVLLDAKHHPVKVYLSNLETINTLIATPSR
jgi:hypothetical protein